MMYDRGNGDEEVLKGRTTEIDLKKLIKTSGASLISVDREVLRPMQLLLKHRLMWSHTT